MILRCCKDRPVSPRPNNSYLTNKAEAFRRSSKYEFGAMSALENMFLVTVLGNARRSIL